MLKSSLCGYSDTYILIKGRIAIAAAEANAALRQADGRNKQVLLKKYALFTDCITKINNRQIDHANDLNVEMSMCNLREDNDNYSKTFRNFWRDCIGEPMLLSQIQYQNKRNNLC